jgi:hypothetical protein
VALLWVDQLVALQWWAEQAALLWVDHHVALQWWVEQAALQ